MVPAMTQGGMLQQSLCGYFKPNRPERSTAVDLPRPWEVPLGPRRSSYSRKDLPLWSISGRDIVRYVGREQQEAEGFKKEMATMRQTSRRVQSARRHRDRNPMI